MHKVLLAFGTRPEAIKMLPVIWALRKQQNIKVIVAVTAQHRQMLDQILIEFGEKPDIDLDLMKSNQTLEGLTALVLTEMSVVLKTERPDLLFVHGDTTTALGSALCGFYSRIPVAHIEAGLRSNDLMQPWPEEMNRVVIDGLATLRFAPTKRAAKALMNEYNSDAKVHVTGNTGIDTLLHVCGILDVNEPIGAEKWNCGLFIDRSERLILVTSHRRESFGDGFDRICDALIVIATENNIRIVFPVHLNPNVRSVVERRLGNIKNITLVEPVGYFDMVRLIRRAVFILTDSGGLQEEAATLGKPVLVLRNVTERPEAVEFGAAKLVGTDTQKIVTEAFVLLNDQSYYDRIARPAFPFGDGTASQQIAEETSNFLQRWSKRN